MKQEKTKNFLARMFLEWYCSAAAIVVTTSKDVRHESECKLLEFLQFSCNESMQSHFYEQKYLYCKIMY